MNDKETFVSVYDNMLLGVAEGVENLVSQVEHTDGIRASVLSNNLMVGFFIAKVYSAIAMAERYLELRPWEEMPERLVADEMNFGMMLHCIDKWDFPAIRERLLYFTDDVMPEEHVNERLRDLEMEIGKKNREVCNGEWLDTLPDMLNDLGMAVKNIYLEEKPDYVGQWSIRAKIPQFDGFMQLCPPSDMLIVQQAFVIDNIHNLVETSLKEIGTWPMAIVQIEMFAADMEEALRTIMSYDCQEFEEGYLDMAIGKCEDAMGKFYDVLDWLYNEYHKVSVAGPETIEGVVGESPFPLVAHSEAAIRSVAGFMFIFPRVILAYKDMAVEYLAQIKRIEGR